MPADLASAAAAVTAGYTKTQYDWGAAKNPRYETLFEKHMLGIPGYSGGPVRHNGQSNVSAAAADTAALAALNGWRKNRYGVDTNVNQGHTGVIFDDGCLLRCSNRIAGPDHQGESRTLFESERLTSIR